MLRRGIKNGKNVWVVSLLTIFYRIRAGGDVFNKAILDL